ncbi:MAG: ABC transporter permease [Candidatus Brocadiia bacterium]
MSMPILALFGFARRFESRRYTTYLARTAVAGVILLYLMLARAGGSMTGAPGLEFFTAVVYVNLAFITLAGLSYFASAIAEEKEEATLGLLRMTRLSPLAILLGKSASRWIGVTLLLLVQLPFTFLAITLGGVAMAQIVAAYVALLAYLVFVSGLAVFCSLLAPNTAKAGGLVAAALAVFYAAPPGGNALLDLLVVKGWLMKNGPVQTDVQAFLALVRQSSPVERVQEILATGFSGSPLGFQVLTNAVMGVGLFLLAWPLFDWLTREQKEPTPYRGMLSTRRRLFSPGRAWRNALMWKDFHFLAGGMVIMIGKFILYGAVIAGAFIWLHREDPRLKFTPDYCQGLKYVLLAAVLIETLIYASRIFNEETAWRTLSSIYVLPLSAGKLAASKALGCLLGVLPVAAYAAGAWALSLSSGGINEDAKSELLMAATLLCQLVFLAHLVVYLSFRMKRGAIAMAILISVVGMPILFSFIGLMGVFYLGQFAYLGGYAAFLLIGSIVLETRIVRALHEAAGA